MKRFIRFAAMTAAAFIDGLMLVLTLGLVAHTSAYCVVQETTWAAFYNAKWFFKASRF